MSKETKSAPAEQKPAAPPEPPSADAGRSRAEAASAKAGPSSTMAKPPPQGPFHYVRQRGIGEKCPICGGDLFVERREPPRPGLIPGHPVARAIVRVWKCPEPKCKGAKTTTQRV